MARRRTSRGWVVRLSIVTSALAASLLFCAPVALADCPPLDAQCELGEGDLPGTEDLPTDPVDEAVDSVRDTIDETAGPVDDPVQDVLDDVLGKDDGGDDGGGGGDDDGDDQNGGKDDPRSDEGSGPADESQSGTGGAGFGTGGPTGSLPQDELSPASSHPAGPLDRLGRAAAEAVKQLGFPLALTLIVIAFLIVQGRIDRKDPKLALAPTRPDVARFV